MDVECVAAEGMAVEVWIVGGEVRYGRRLFGRPCEAWVRHFGVQLASCYELRGILLSRGRTNWLFVIAMKLLSY